MKPNRTHERMKHGSPSFGIGGRAASPKGILAKGKTGVDSSVQRPLTKPSGLTHAQLRKSPTSSIYEGER